jgi:hypothetical protein
MIRFEEYRLFIEDTARLSDRRQTVSNVIVAVNAFLVAGVGILFAGVDHDPSGRLLIAVLLLVVAIAVCWIWRTLIRRYHEIISERLRHLEMMELEIENSYEWYRKLDDAFSGEVPSFSRVEQWIPCTFIGLYFFLLFGALLWLALLS